MANTLADDLSHTKAAHFLSSHIQTDRYPTPIPEELLNILVISKPDWTSQTVDRYFLQVLAPLTQCTYTSAKNRYIRFCQTFQLSAIPANEHDFQLLWQSNLYTNQLSVT